MANKEATKNIADAGKNMLHAWNTNQSAVDSVVKYCLDKGMDFKWTFYHAVSAYAKDLDIWCSPDNAPLG